MSTQVSTAFVQQYNTNVDYLLQQRGSRLQHAVTKSTAVGKAAKAVEQVGAVGAVKRTTRHGDTPLISTPHDARWAFPVDYEWADLIDDQDKLRMLIDPQSPYAMNAAYAMGRAIDDEIIGAFDATAKTGENGTTDTPLPAAQTITTAGGLTLPKLKAAKLLLMAAEVDVDNDPLWMAVSAEQHDDLLSFTGQETESADFNTTRVLVDGKITRFMGFNFIHSERLSATGSTRLCPIWAQSGMHCVTWEGLYSQITERPDKSYSTQVYCRETIGATRLEEQKIVMMECDE